MRHVLLLGLTTLLVPPTVWSAPPSLSSIPDKEGFAGSFAGVSSGALLVAGGANFPDKKPWEGGKKVWSDTVFVLDRPTGEWKIAGKLPRNLAYGVSASHGAGVVCVGGSDADRHYPDAFRLEWKDGKLVTTSLPPLPKPVANACAALVGDTLYIAGGSGKPDAAGALKSVFRIDLAVAKPAWHEIEACLGRGRILATAAAFDGAFWLIGGADLVTGTDGKTERCYLKDAYRYAPDRGWGRVADLPYPVAAAPSPAPTDTTGVYLLGGDDGSKVGLAPDRHPGFRKAILRYNPREDKWVAVGKLAAARVTAPVVRWNDLWVIPGGEVRPGVRSPEVWSTPGLAK